jgi:hypothetical protein
MSAELVSYEGRMASMTHHALDEPRIEAVAKTLSGLGLDVEAPRVLSLEDSGKPAAWILVARRR